MSVHLADETIVLEGDCPVDEAEALLELLLANPDAPVDWTDCNRLHTSVIQVLIVARRPMKGEPGNAFLRGWIGTHIQAP